MVILCYNSFTQVLTSLLLFVCFLVRGESPGCRLFGTASMFEWLRNLLSSPLTGKQYGKMEPKYPEGGRCQSVLRPQRFFKRPPLFLNNSVETAAPFNVVSHPRCCVPRNLFLEKFRPLAGFEPVGVGICAGGLTIWPPQLTFLLLENVTL